MNLFKIILITSAVNLPLSVYVSRLMPPSVAVVQSEHPPAIAAATQVVPTVVNNTVKPEHNEALALLKTQVQALSADVVALREEMHTIVKTKAAAVILGRDVDNVAPPSEEAARAEEEKYFAAQGVALESDFRQQTVELNWSTEAMNLIRTGLASDKISGSAIIGLECRTRTCRLELANNGKNHAPDFVEFPQHIADELSNLMISQTESTDGATVFYLSKEAFTQPK